MLTQAPGTKSHVVVVIVQQIAGLGYSQELELSFVGTLTSQRIRFLKKSLKGI